MSDKPLTPHDNDITRSEKGAESDASIIMTFTVNSRSISIPCDNIAYIYCSNRIAHVVTFRGELAVSDLFKNISEQLDGISSFCPINRNCFVNLKYVADIDGNSVIVSAGARQIVLNISRRMKSRFIIRLTEWIAGCD